MDEEETERTFEKEGWKRRWKTEEELSENRELPGSEDVKGSESYKLRCHK